MSPRAAWRLEELGFPAVSDYAAGKVDWLAAGKPTEGTAIPSSRVISALERDIPSCGLNDTAGPAIKAALDKGWSTCVVVNDNRIVAGRLRAQHVDPDDQRRAEDAMEPGPATIRAHEDLKATRERMSSRHVAVLLVTTPEGELLGALTS
jgi:predicted transcriptional regulator